MVESMLKSPLIEQFSEDGSMQQPPAKKKKSSSKKPPQPNQQVPQHHPGQTQGSGFNNPLSYPGSQANTHYSKFYED